MGRWNRAAQAADFGGSGGQVAIPTHPLITEGILAGQHPQRTWEYSQALDALETWANAKWEQSSVEIRSARFADVGGAGSNFCQALGSYSQHPVLRIDPHLAPVWGEYTIPLTVRGFRAHAPDYQADAVFCLSVLEHVPPAEVVPFIRDLAALVAPGGLLVLTCDYADGTDAPYHFAHMRDWMPEAATIGPLLEVLGAQGFSALDAVDLGYYGPTVYNYTFLSLALVKG